MTGQCCTGEGPSRRLARRFPGVAGSILPGTALVLLPKCPLCLAAWITAVTGFGVPMAVAAHVRGGIVAVWIGALGFAIIRIARRSSDRRQRRGARV
jgi:hypothetical protein